MAAAAAMDYDPGPDLDPGDAALGRQRSSMRPTSARYSIGRSPRGLHSSSRETPGPASYQRAPQLGHGVPAAVFGDTRQDEGSHFKPYAYPQVDDFNIVNVASVQPASTRTTIGQEKRGGKVVDPELIRQCPESKHGCEGPGPIYEPNYRSVSCGATGRGRRPSSAPAYSIGRERKASTGSAPSDASGTSKVAPNAYETERAFGKQTDSRRRTSRSSSFSRSDRFAPPKRASGDLSAECSSAAPTLGRREVGRPAMRRPASATFGSASREASANRKMCVAPGDKTPSAGRQHPPRLPHPPLAPQRELLKWNSSH